MRSALGFQELRDNLIELLRIIPRHSMACSFDFHGPTVLENLRKLLCGIHGKDVAFLASD